MPSFPDNINYDELHLNSLETLRDAKKCVNDVLTAPGFTIIMAITQRAMASHLNEMLAPCKTMEEVLAAENKKGYYQGLNMAFRGIPAWIETVQAAIDFRLKHDVPEGTEQ